MNYDRVIVELLDRISLLEEKTERLEKIILGLAQDTARLAAMSEAAQRLAKPDAARRVADLCMEACHG